MAIAIALKSLGPDHPRPRAARMAVAAVASWRVASRRLALAADRATPTYNATQYCRRSGGLDWRLRPRLCLGPSLRPVAHHYDQHGRWQESLSASPIGSRLYHTVTHTVIVD